MSLISRMSAGLQLPEHYIVGLARTASHLYKTYRIPKRTGGTREINHPSRELKAVQRWLVATEINEFDVHPAAMAYRPGIGIRTNALLHASGRYLLRLDVQAFFPSILASDVYGLLGDLRPTWSDEDHDHFCSLVCRWGQLTIGAPSSPALSNSICFQLDTQISALAASRRVTYSRYADDMFFSSDTPDILKDLPGAVAELLRTVEYPKGLDLNQDKTHHSSRKNRREVTGLVITPQGRVTIGRKRKREVRSRIHRYKELSVDEKRSLAGYLSYAKSVEPDFLNALILKYGKSQIDTVRVPPKGGVQFP